MQDSEDRIIKVDIEREMRSSFLDYSMSVIVARALPDARDGFKPVHRRILYGMRVDGNTHDHHIYCVLLQVLHHSLTRL